MTRFLHTFNRGFFSPAVIIAITLTLAASYHVGNAAAATFNVGAVSTTIHHERIANIARSPKGVSKHREPIAHIAKAPNGAK